MSLKLTRLAFFWGLAIAFLCTSMTCSSKKTTEKNPKTGLVKKINSTEIKIHDGKSAVLDNEKLQSRFFLVRHAEKMDQSKDPDLSAEGYERAQRLATILKKMPLRRIYSTNYRRTQLTVSPTAKAMHLQMLTYMPTDYQKIFDQLLLQPGNGHYLMVGHSNTIPQMVNYLTGKEEYRDLPDDVYDSLFVVSVYEDKRVEVLELKY